MPARAYDLLSVRVTMTFLRWVSDKAVVQAKSTYASSITSGPPTSSANRSNSGSGTSVPDGELGLARKVR